MDRFATTSFTRQLLLQSSSFQILVGVLDKSLETNVCKYQVPRDDKIVDHSHGITLNESTAPDTFQNWQGHLFVVQLFIFWLNPFWDFSFSKQSVTLRSFVERDSFRIVTETMPFRKMSTPENWWNYGILRSVISSHIFGVRKERERLSVPK